jgi:hypothetical protein
MTNWELQYGECRMQFRRCGSQVRALVGIDFGFLIDDRVGDPFDWVEILHCVQDNKAAMDDKRLLVFED